MPDWDFDVSTGTVLQVLAIYLTSANNINEKNNEQAFLQDDSWANHFALSKEHRFILAITDYFSKWIEVITMRKVKMTDESNSSNIM